MMIRKLGKEEHDKSRQLYETVFFEDEKCFVDYYYQYRARENVIFTAEDEAGLHAMVHLNPCRIAWNGRLMEINYLVAVATEEKYRHQGLMRSLLELALKEEDKRKAPFLFLMPASEAIYTPFGFRRAWSWRWEDEIMDRQAAYGLQAAAAGGPVWIPAKECGEAELTELSRRVNKRLAQSFSMFSWRSPAYYQRLAKEQEASGGRLEVLFEKGMPVTARCSAREEFPPMMARIVNLEAFLARVQTKQERTCIWQIHDELLPDNCGLFQVTLTGKGGHLRRLREIEAAADDSTYGNMYDPEPENAGTDENRQDPGIMNVIASGKRKQPVRKLDISRIPEALGEDNPFLHAMICEVV